MSIRRLMNLTMGHLVVAALAVGVVSCLKPDVATNEGKHGGEPAEAKGSHGGRLLADGDFALEITIFERGVPPELRVYPLENGEPAALGDVQLAIDLHRFGGRVDEIHFAPREDYLLGDVEVEEPHSFDVEVTAKYRGRDHRWRYESYEGRTELSPVAIASSGITIATAGPATIRTVVETNGRVVPNEDHLAHVTPRFPGIVREVRRRLGDRVLRGETLAVVQSNESMQAYDVPSAIAGTIIAKRVTPGELARESDVIYTVADLSTVWADLNVAREDFRRLRIGQMVTLSASGGVSAQGPIVYLSPIGAESTQLLLARVEVANPTGEWNPGLYVSGELVVEETNVPIAVQATALQTFRDWNVVFLNDGPLFQAMPLELGRRDAEHVEVIGGLRGGERYAAENSFIVKADVGKSGATHDH